MLPALATISQGAHLATIAPVVFDGLDLPSGTAGRAEHLRMFKDIGK